MQKTKNNKHRNFAFFILYLALFSSMSMIALPSNASPEAAPPKIKILVLEENHNNIPEKDEKMEMVGNMKGDLFASGTQYSGNIEVWRGEKGLYIINELPIENYIESVVASEVGTSWDIEALKAQAVIARTYAVYRKTTNMNSKYHLTSSVLHQVYKGNTSHIQIAYAVRNTAGEILTYNGKPIEALYHSTCGGKTETPEDAFGKSYPYLKSVESSCELSPYWVWERKIPKTEIEKALNISDMQNITITSTTTTGRAKELSIESGSGKSLIKATELRKLLGWSRLPSTNFSIKINDDTVIFEGKGYGHGVGLCQWSALQMAREGKTYKEILSFFYPGTELSVYESD